MYGTRIPITTWLTVFFLYSLPFQALAQDARGPAGLPAYIRSPQDRPPPAGIEPVIVAPNLTMDGVLATISPKDSVIVISGKVDMGGREYYSAYPKFRGGSLYGAMTACKREYLMKPQYRSTEKEGYAMFVVVKETASDPDCWNQFRNLDTVDLSCDQIMVKTRQADAPVVWDNPASSYANSYDLRTFRLDAVTPK